MAPAELDLIIGVITGSTTVATPGPTVSIASWKKQAPASPFYHAVIEWTAASAASINDGTIAQMIGLYGKLPSGVIYLLGVLGAQLGAASPQIRIANAACGYAQIVNFAALYEEIGIGVINGAAITGLPVYRVTARPIFERIYGG